MRNLVAAGLLLASSAASAQPYPPPPAPYPAPHVSVEQPRDGLTFGVGVNVGSLVAECMDCSNTWGAGGFDARIGVMLSPRLALYAESWAMVHSNGFLTVYQHLATVSARVWVAPRVWLQAGVGAATAGYRWQGLFVDREDRTESSPGIAFAGGYEIPVGRATVLDLQLRAGTGFYDKDPVDGYVIEGHSVGVGAALSWY